jgi:hypothetical protein
VFSKKFVSQGNFVLDLLVGAPRDADASPLCQALHTGGYIDPIPVDPLSFLDHIPKVDPDAKLHLAVFRQNSIPGL